MQRRGGQEIGLQCVRTSTGIWLLALIVAALAISVLLFLGKHALSAMLYLALEQRFPPIALGAEQQVDGIIAPGGDFRRFEIAVNLAKRFPRARLLLITGGQIEQARTYAMKQGIPDTQLMIEARSKSTYENARFSATLLHPHPCQRWVLVTSASHMPRAVGTFRKAGFKVLPWPVFHTIRQRDTLGIAIHEWLGLVAYWFLGRTDALFTGPDGGPLVSHTRHDAESDCAP
jgi:uncharacterized SAM-binding protein YcdF (DUF218 family)